MQRAQAGGKRVVKSIARRTQGKSCKERRQAGQFLLAQIPSAQDMAVSAGAYLLALVEVCAIL